MTLLVQQKKICHAHQDSKHTFGLRWHTSQQSPCKKIRVTLFHGLPPSVPLEDLLWTHAPRHHQPHLENSTHLADHSHASDARSRRRRRRTCGPHKDQDPSRCSLPTSIKRQHTSHLTHMSSVHVLVHVRECGCRRAFDCARACSLSSIRFFLVLLW